MNKIFNKLFWVMAVCGLTMTACSDVPDREPSPEIPANCNGVYFDENYKIIKELEPEAATIIDVKISREKSTEAIDVPLKVIEDKNNVFSVPESVSFAAGESTTTVSISFNNAPLGVTHKLLWALEGEDVNVYSQNISTIQVEVTRVKWDPIDTTILVDALVGKFYGVGYPMPFYVTGELATYPDGSQRVRLLNPYNSGVATGNDADGIYDAYPYNDPGDLLDKEIKMIIDIDGDKANMQNTSLGFAWGYGEFSTGSSYNLNNTYDQGKAVYDDDGKLSYIEFAKETLFVSMATLNDGAKYLTDRSQYIFFSVDAYKGIFSED